MKKLWFICFAVLGLAQCTKDVQPEPIGWTEKQVLAEYENPDEKMSVSDIRFGSSTVKSNALFSSWFFKKIDYDNVWVYGDYMEDFIRAGSKWVDLSPELLVVFYQSKKVIAVSRKFSYIPHDQRLSLDKLFEEATADYSTFDSTLGSAFTQMNLSNPLLEDVLDSRFLPSEDSFFLSGLSPVVNDLIRMDIEWRKANTYYWFTLVSGKEVDGDQVCVDFLTQQPVLYLVIIADSSVTEELLPLGSH